MCAAACTFMYVDARLPQPFSRAAYRGCTTPPTLTSINAQRLALEAFMINCVQWPRCLDSGPAGLGIMAQLAMIHGLMPSTPAAGATPADSAACQDSQPAVNAEHPDITGPNASREK